MWAMRAAGVSVLLALSGCGGASGPERCAVSGAVSYEGTAIESGSIAFLPTSGKGPSAGGAIKDGRYEISAELGPGIGAHRVEIIGLKSEGTKTVEGVQGHVGGPSGTSTVAELKMIVPDVFNTKSTLTADIKSGANKLDFPLKKP